MRCRVLIADDDAMNRLVAVESLKYLECQTDAVSTGTEALDALEAQPFDLVLMDVHMPDLTGIEATLELRRREAASGRARMPVIALTASATAKDQQACMEAGMDGVLTKPFRIEQLKSVIDLWCPQR
jgi:CheY-like chemotaxis protein